MTELRENIINLIPSRSIFLKHNEKINPSKEDLTIIKDNEIKKNIYIEIQIEDKNDTMEFDIYLNGKSYTKKQFYISIKLKSFRNNLKFDYQSYKIIFKGNPLTIEEENNITLDELCYKELKVSFFKVKEDNIIYSNIIQKSNNIIFEQCIYKNKETFKNNENFETWILLGKGKSGKTTFINCLVNYCLDVKYDDKFRYIIKENNTNIYGLYDIKGNSNSTIIRIIEFPGFSIYPEEDQPNADNIQRFLKVVNNIKIICFIINGNQTRLTDEIRIIFSTVLSFLGMILKTILYFY